MTKILIPPQRYYWINAAILLCLLCTFFIFKNCIALHLHEQKTYTSTNAKSRILGFQTPNFTILAKWLYTKTPIAPNQINDRLQGQFFLMFYEKAAALYPDSFEMHHCLGFCQLIAGDTAKAKASFIASLKINPTFIYSYYNLAIILLQEGNLPMAKQMLATALSLDPSLTIKPILEQQAFTIIWRFFPKPETYIAEQLKETLLTIHALNNGNPTGHDIHPILF